MLKLHHYHYRQTARLRADTRVLIYSRSRSLAACNFGIVAELTLFAR
jgi:hypothetical protein